MIRIACPEMPVPGLSRYSGINPNSILDAKRAAETETCYLEWTDPGLPVRRETVIVFLPRPLLE
jgi:hypothetical protein